MQFDFSKSLTVDNLESVPEDFRGLYKEVDGKHKLESDHPGVKSTIAAVLRLSSALNASRADAAAAKSRVVDLSLLSEYGDSPEAIASSFTAKLTEAGKKKGGEDLSAHLERQKKELETTFTAEIKKRDDRAMGLVGQLHKLIVENQATIALADAKAIDPDLVLPHIKARVRVEEKDGELMAVVLEGSEPRYSGSTGKLMTIKEFVTELKGTPKFKPLFQSEAPAGGGAPPRGPRKPEPQGADKSSTDKIAAGLSNLGR